MISQLLLTTLAHDKAQAPFDLDSKDTAEEAKFVADACKHMHAFHKVFGEQDQVAPLVVVSIMLLVLVEFNRFMAMH